MGQDGGSSQPGSRSTEGATIVLHIPRSQVIELTLQCFLQGLFESIPEALFRSDISSTELRNKGEGLAG